MSTLLALSLPVALTDVQLREAPKNCIVLEDDFDLISTKQAPTYVSSSRSGVVDLYYICGASSSGSHRHAHGPPHVSTQISTPDQRPSTQAPRPAVYGRKGTPGA